MVFKLKNKHHVEGNVYHVRSIKLKRPLQVIATIDGIDGGEWEHVSVSLSR